MYTFSVYIPVCIYLYIYVFLSVCVYIPILKNEEKGLALTDSFQNLHFKSENFREFTQLISSHPFVYELPIPVFCFLPEPCVCVSVYVCDIISLKN